MSHFPTVNKPVFNTEILKPGAVVEVHWPGNNRRIYGIVLSCFEDTLEVECVLHESISNKEAIEIDLVRDKVVEIEIVRLAPDKGLILD